MDTHLCLNKANDQWLYQWTIAPNFFYQDTIVSFLQSILNMKRDQNIKVMFGVNVGALNLSLHLHRSLQKLDFSIDANTTDKRSVINRSKLF